MKRIILPLVALLISYFSNAQVCTKAQLPANFQNGLVAFYPFCGNANDLSGNGNNGTVFGATLTTDRFGNANSAYYFSGASCNTYIQATVNTATIQTGVTISVWVNRSGDGCNNPRLFEFWPGSDGPTQAQWQWSNPNAIAMGHRTSTGTYVTTEVPAPGINVWTHLVYTNDGSSAKFYRDGQLVATLASSGNPTLASNLAIGRMNHSGWDAFNGKIDDFIVLSKALSACEVQQLFSETSVSVFTPGGFNYDALPIQKTVCGISTTLDAGSGYSTYLWSTGATSQTITATASGEYRVTVTNASGCAASDTGLVNLVKADILQSNSTICKGTAVTLSVDSAFAAQNLNNINLLPSNLKAGLKAYYPFSGNANDASGNNNNGTVTGATLTTDRFGNANSAYSFNGSSFIDLGNIAGLGYSAAQDITTSFWINEGASGTVISKYTNLDAGNSNFFFSKATTSAQVAGNGTNSFTANNITDYRWTNYVFVASAGTNKSFIYRNGILVATGSLNANGSLSATKMMLGKLMGSPSNFFTGKIDDVFIYNRVLTVSEIAQLSNFQPKVSWSNGATTNTISVTPTATTKYYATVTDGITSCIDSVTITVDDIGSFNPFPAQSSTCGATKSLDAGAGFTSYLWSTGATSQTISPTINGEYRVTVTNAAGCSASDTVGVSLINANIIQSNQTVCANTTLSLFIDSTFSGSVINAKSQMSANLQTGLVAYYPFNGNANDISGNNNVLTANGVTLTTDRFGRSNSAYSFTNTQTSVTNYLKAVNPTPFAKNTYTISAWFNSRQFYPNIGGVSYNYQSIVFYSPQWYVYGPAYHIALQHANNSVLEGGNWTTTNTNQGVTSPNGSIVVNQWYHVVLSYDGTTLKMYKDGQLVGSRTATISYANQIQFLIGGAGDGPSPGGIYGGFNGKIDDVGFWDRSLTFNEVQELYNGRPSVLWSTSETSNKISVTPIVTTKYYASLTDGIATCTDSVTITVDNLSAFNPLQDTVKVCGDSTVLDAGAGYASYNWSNGATTRTITAKASGKYYVSVATAAGCSASDTSFVSIVKAKIIQRDTTICKGSKLILNNLNPLLSKFKYLGSIDGKDYYLRDSLMKWVDANQFSKDLGGQLYVIKNQRQEDSVYSWLPYKGSDQMHYWLGLYQDVNSPTFLEPSGGWTWVDGSALTYSNWQTGEPNNRSCVGAPENYAQLDWDNFGKKWNDADESISICGTGGVLGLSFPIVEFVGKKILWSTGDTTNTISVAPTITTKYFVTVSDGITTCRDSITVTVSDIGSFNPLQDTAKVCGDSAVLDAGAGYATYNWSNGATTRTLTAKASGKYYVSVVTAEGCSASDTSFVSIVNAKIIQRDTTICKGASILLEVNNSNPRITACDKTSLPLNLQNQLIAYYPFCGNANDVSGNGNTGTVYNAQLTNDRFGNPNSAYYFNGTNAYMASFPIFNPYPLSVSLWVKPDAFDKLRTIFQWNSESQANSSTHSPDLYFENNKFGFHTWTTTRGDISITSDSNYNISKWYHIVTIHSNDTLKFYINGVLQAQFNTNNNSHFQPYFILAKYLSCGGNCDYFKGALDDVFIFNKALTSAEVQQLYTSTPVISWSSGQSSSSITVTPATTTKYFVTVSDGITTCRDSITVTVSDIGAFNPLQDTVKVCGDSIVLDAGAGFATYNWSNGATTRTINVKASGKYFVRVNNASGCSASDTSVISIVKANIIQNDTTICKGSSIKLSADSIINGLLAYYPLDNNAQDLSGNNMNGVVTGATPTTDRFGEVNKAYFFNGTSDYIRVNHDSRLNRLPLTVSCWFNASQQISPAGALVGKYYAASWTGWQLTLNEYGPSSQRLDPWYIRSPNNYIKNSSSTPNFYTTQIIDSTWHHVAFVIDSTSGKIYLDGNLQATSTWVGPAGIPNNSLPMYFGYYPSGNAQPNVYYYRGKIDDIRLYYKALNGTEVQNAMSNTITNLQYLWSTGATTPTIQVSPTVTTKYFVTVTDGITTCRDSVTIKVDDLSAFNPLQDTVKVCGDSTVLDAGAGFATYNWSNGATTRTISAKTSGKYYVSVATAAGCSASDTSFVSIVNAKIKQRDTTICKGTSLTLSANQSGYYRSSAIDSVTISISSYNSKTFNTVVGKKYRFEISGNYSAGTYCPSFAEDPAFILPGFYGNSVAVPNIQNCNAPGIFVTQFCPQLPRPTPDIYNPQHVYNYYFTAASSSFDAGWQDPGLYGDNCGSLTFKLYEDIKPETITWSTGATTPSITVNPTVKTTYTVTVTDGINTCTDSVIVDVSSSELKVTDPAAVCSPAVVNLTAAAITSGSATGLTYTYWKDANATQALANPDKVSVSGTYYIVGTSSTGCTSAPTAVKVTVNPLPTATIIAPSQTAICDKSSITLTARGGTSYQWLLNGSAIAGATDSTYAASQAGSYEVNVIALGCTSKVAAPVNLTLIKAAIPKFSNSSTCIDVPVSFFNETDTTLSGSVNFVWDFGDGQTSTLFNPVYTYKKSGAYIVKLTVTPKLCNSLPVSFTKNITVDIPPVGIKYPNVLAVKNKATQLSARFIANGYTYLWMPSTGLNNGALQKPIFNASNEQLYRVRLTSASGCITMDTVKVSVYDSSDIFVPKAFSPNKDGKNDLLQPFLVNITTLKFFRIYNRWGQLMFQSSDSKQGWDGMYNYKPQPLETYTWIAEGIDGNGTTIFRKGQTVLIR